MHDGCATSSQPQRFVEQNLEEDDIENLLIQQIEFCNIILLNKAADVTAEELGKVKRHHQGIAAEARRL